MDPQRGVFDEESKIRAPVHMDPQWGVSDEESDEDDIFFESWPVKQRT